MDETTNAIPQKDESLNSRSQKARKSVRVSVGLSAEFAEELDAYITENGISNRPAAIEALVRDQIRRIQAERAWLERHQEAPKISNVERIAKTEGGKRTYVYAPYDQLSDEQFEAQLATETRKQKRAFDFENERLIFVQEDEGSGKRVFSVSLFEIASKNNPLKQVRIRNYWKTEGDILYPIDILTVPRSWVKWLIEALQNAEKAALDEASRNRRRAQEKRSSRNLEEIAREKELRELYIERYSKERVARAKMLSGRHQIRAVRREQTEHFTAWEWLDLCAKYDFGCACCGLKVQMEPHHKVELSQGGYNTIDNIEPLCRECHKAINPISEERVQSYLLKQQRLLEIFKSGDRVRAKYSPKSRVGTITELLPLKPNLNSAWPKIEKDDKGNIHRFWTRWEERLSSAQAHVIWSGKTRRAAAERTADLEDLVKIEEEDFMNSQKI